MSAKDGKHLSHPQERDTLPAVNWTKLIRIVREEVLKEAQQDSCVLSVAALLQVLDVLGIEAKPLTVRVMIFGPPMARYFQSGQIPPKPSELKTLLRKHNAHSVGIGYTPGATQESVIKGKKWNGHLVVVIPKDQEYLIADPSLDQASRPHKKMLLEPVLLRVDAEFLAGKSSAIGFLNDSVLIYDAFPEDTVWQAAPDWLIFERRLDIVNRVLARMDEIEGEEQK